MTALERGHTRGAREQLERAEAALLNGEETDRSMTIDTWQAMPESQPMREIVDARMHLHNRSQAIQSANQAITALRGGANQTSKAPASGSL